MINNRKKIINIVVWVVLAILVILLVAEKLSYMNNQMAEVYFSSYAPIDDTLMYDSAVSITKGEWLGDYSWKTMSKHMFFSVWLALLSVMGIPYLIGGQLLYLVACIAAAWAIMPIFMHKQWSVAVFTVLWFSPYSWAQFTLRVYRDNIFPSLCLLFFAGLIGIAVRYNNKPIKSLGFAVVAGLGLGLSWLTREDGVWLLPFAICATIAYVVILLLQKNGVKNAISHAIMPVISVAVCLACVGLYCYQNYQYYGRFIISDFTSSEFEDAVGALLRVETDGAHDKKILVCKETRDKTAKAVPLYAEIEKAIKKNPALYGGYGFPEVQEFNSGGFNWALRVAVSEAGYYKDAVTVRKFYQELADAINKACDDGMLEHKGGKKSTTVIPWQSEFLVPTLNEFGNSVRCLLRFEQTSSLASLSNAPEEQAAEMSAFLHQEVSDLVSPDTGQAMYSPVQRDTENSLNSIKNIYKAFILPALVLGLVVLAFDIKKAINEIKNKQTGAKTMRAVIMLGIALSIILRIGIVSYIEAASFRIGTYLLYLSSAGPLLLLFVVYGTIGAVELIEKAATDKINTDFQNKSLALASDANETKSNHIVK